MWKSWAGIPLRRRRVYAVASTAGIFLVVKSGLVQSPAGGSPFTYVSADTIKAGCTGALRSSRAIFTFACNIADYKYSLRGMVVGSDDYRRKLSEVHLRSARRILKLCETNRGFYVKAGQFIGSLRHVPKEYSSILSSLQDQAIPCDFETIREVLIQSFGNDLPELFSKFDEQPIAAASIAQVHHAVLRDFQEVAVKVQYPGLEDRMKMDIATMSILSKSLSWAPFFPFSILFSQFKGLEHCEVFELTRIYRGTRYARRWAIDKAGDQDLPPRY